MTTERAYPLRRWNPDWGGCSTARRPVAAVNKLSLRRLVFVKRFTHEMTLQEVPGSEARTTRSAVAHRTWSPRVRGPHSGQERPVQDPCVDRRGLELGVPEELLDGDQIPRGRRQIRAFFAGPQRIFMRDSQVAADGDRVGGEPFGGPPIWTVCQSWVPLSSWAHSG